MLGHLEGRLDKVTAVIRQVAVQGKALELAVPEEDEDGAGSGESSGELETPALQSSMGEHRIVNIQEPAPGPPKPGEPQEEREPVCVGVLHVSSRTGWACHMTECMESYHALRVCNFFRSLSAGERTRRVRSLRLCEGCLTFGHSTRARSCPFRKGDDGLCPVRTCGRGHHRLLHDGGGGGNVDSQD